MSSRPEKMFLSNQIVAACRHDQMSNLYRLDAAYDLRSAAYTTISRHAVAVAVAVAVAIAIAVQSESPKPDTRYGGTVTILFPSL